MANIEITNNTTRGIVIWEPVFEDATATFAGAETWPQGAVLAKLTATGNYVRFNPAGSGGAEVPLAVLTQNLEADAAGDLPFRPAISGRVRLNDLIDSAGTALTAAAVDQLRDYTIIAQSTTQLSEFDNQ